MCIEGTFTLTCCSALTQLRFTWLHLLPGYCWCSANYPMVTLACKLLHSPHQYLLAFDSKVYLYVWSCSLRNFNLKRSNKYKKLSMKVILWMSQAAELWVIPHTVTVFFSPFCVAFSCISFLSSENFIDCISCLLKLLFLRAGDKCSLIQP